MSTRAIIYARISSDQTGEAAGVTRQLDDCRRLAESKGFEVVAELVDNDVSAYAAVRPGWEEVLNLIKSGSADALIAWHPDRLYRRPLDLEALLPLIEDGGLPAGLHTVTAGEFDLNTPTGRAIARTLVAWSNHEVEHGKARMKAAHLKAAEQGKPHAASKGSYGFTDDGITHDPVQAPLLRDAAQMVVDGHSLSATTRWLEAQGMTAKSGKALTPATLRSVLLSPRLRGKRTHKGAEYDAVWEPILDEILAERVRAALQDSTRKHRGGRPPIGTERHVFWLSRVIRCGLCNAKLRSEYRGSGGSEREGAYVCRTSHDGCGKVSVSASRAEETVSEIIVGTLSQPETIEQMGKMLSGSDHADEVEATFAEIRELEQREVDLGVEIAEGRMSAAVGSPASARITASLDEARRRLTRLIGEAKASSFVFDPDVEWANLPDAEKRNMTTMLLDGVTVASPTRLGSPFDKSRIRVIWKE